ncbi:LysR family transcriptional regulator [Paraferrimonas sedimenticola]|uniref:LysR family transcriptional regulator n=1 Tax=Paraferrimonas sedimenticola TaxID=375674 RepID=A0AA37RX46_9GAMM|nr:LysR family transcriptional regulator [Paraferrimonas sedimenticola]GLP96307.1 LysR family transcriptional regulator [Paraferrimonas sedimenticola]
MSRSIEQLSAFVETVESGGFKAAGRKIGKHAVTVSGLVANLEADLGFDLFVRKPRSIEITEKGEELYKHAKSALHELDYFDAKASSMLEGLPSKLTLAIDPSLVGPDLADVFRQLMLRFPTLELVILSGDPLLIRSWVLSNQADIGFGMTTVTNHKEIEVVHTFSFAIQMVAHPELALPSDTVTEHQLRALPQLSLKFFKDIGMQDAHDISHRVTRCASMIDILHLLKSCPCWASAPAFMVKNAIDNNELKPFSMIGGNVADWYTQLQWRAEKPMNDAMKLFIDLVKQIPDRN